jgi:hypothetical protein
VATLVFLLKGFTSSSEYTLDLWAVVESVDGASEGGGTDIAQQIRVMSTGHYKYITASFKPSETYSDI